MGFLCAIVVGLLLSGCATSPKTYRAIGMVAGSAVDTRVDSPIAAYYLGQYLAGVRARPEIDRRIEALYETADATGLPDRERLGDIAKEFSVDFAALYFADRIGRVERNRIWRTEFIRQVKLTQTSGVARANGSDQYEFLFVPGFLYRRHPETGADLISPHKALRDAGIATHWVETDEEGTFEENAEILLGELRSRSKTKRKIILVSASKGGPEVALALTNYFRENRDGAKAWINLVGTLQGSALADDIMSDGPLSRYRSYFKSDSLKSINTANSRARFDSFDLPETLLIVNYIGIPVIGTVSSMADIGYDSLRRFGPNDGLSLLGDLIAPNSITLADFGRDHCLLGESIGKRAVALANAVMNRLEACEESRKAIRATQRPILSCGLAKSSRAIPTDVFDATPPTESDPAPRTIARRLPRRYRGGA